MRSRFFRERLEPESEVSLELLPSGHSITERDPPPCLYLLSRTPSEGLMKTKARITGKAMTIDW